jgi:hypothetical protein
MDQEKVRKVLRKVDQKGRKQFGTAYISTMRFAYFMLRVCDEKELMAFEKITENMQDNPLMALMN